MAETIVMFSRVSLSFAWRIRAACRMNWQFLRQLTRRREYRSCKVISHAGLICLFSPVPESDPSLSVSFLVVLWTILEGSNACKQCGFVQHGTKDAEELQFCRSCLLFFFYTYRCHTERVSILLMLWWQLYIIYGSIDYVQLIASRSTEIFNKFSFFSHGWPSWHLQGYWSPWYTHCLQSEMSSN